MNHLTDKQQEYIISEISQSCISKELKDDLTDHFCCLVEDEMRKGRSFEEAYHKAYKNICPNGFEEIQRETIYLLNNQKLEIMKKMMIVSAFLSSSGILFGALFKLQHWPYSGFLLLFGLFFLVLCLTTLFIYLYKQEITKHFSNKLKYLSGFLGAFSLFLGLFFYLNHWQYSTLLFIVAIFFLDIVFLPLIFYKEYKRKLT